MGTPSSDLWRHDLALGTRYVAGADEVGRGCWAGPIVGAAVLLDLKMVEIEQLIELNDSKKLSPAKREVLLAELLRQQEAGAVRIARCWIGAPKIDRIGIQDANRQVLARTLNRVSEGLDDVTVLVDAFRLDGARSIIKGDATSAAIAAASIVAKQLRDGQLLEADQRLPLYGFASHKGYGSKAHRAAIDEHGVTDFHRRSFKPMSEMP